MKSVIGCALVCLATACRAGFFGENRPTFEPGSEFPGASGSLAVVSSDQLELKYDFSKGGHYVAALCPLAKKRTVGAFRAEFSHDVDVRLSVRIVDATGQTFVRTTGILSGEWERSVWIPGETGWMSWGGAADKVFHQPATRIDFIAENTTPDRLGGTAGMLRVRGVEVTDDPRAWGRPAFAPPHVDLSLETALERIKTARARLAPAVMTLEAKGLGAKSRASLATVDDFLAWIAEDRFQGKKERALREARELTLVAERAADRAEGVLAGRICDFPVPRYRLGSNVISRAQVIGERVWPDGHADRGPVFFTGYGHFQRVRTEVAKLPPLGLNFLQMEFGVRQVLPTETSVGKWQLENFAKDAKRAEAAHVGIAVLLSPHYWPAWTFRKWPDLKCGCYAGYCPYHPAAREVLNRYFETLLPRMCDSPAVHSIVLSNEPSTRPNPKCPRVRAAFAQWLERRYKGDIAAYNQLTGKAYSAFGEVPVPAGVDNKSYSVELADFVRFNREYFADWHRWMAERVRALAPNIPVHVKIQANCLNWSDSNPVFYSIDPVAFGRMSDFNGNDAVVSSEEDGNGLWCANWWDMEAAYDMQRTVVDKPIVNTENHLQRDRSQGFYQPGAHSYAALWQNALHGQNGSALWCWERAFDDGQSDFNGLALDRPEAFEAYSHCALDLMRLSDELATLQNLPPRILILHSTAYFLDGGRARFAATHRAANFLGEPLGVVTEETLAHYGASGSPVARPFDTARVLLVPKTDRALLPVETQRGLERFRAEGGLVLDELPQQEHGLFAWLAGMRATLPGVLAPIAEEPGKPGRPVFGVETRGLRNASRTLLSVCNWTRTAKRVRFEAPAKDLLSGREIPQECVVEPLQPMLLETSASPVVAFAAADRTEWVDTLIGGSYRGHTFPGAACPFGLVQPSPDTGLPDWDHCSGYVWEDPYVYGFTQTHLSGTGCYDLADVRLLPFSCEFADSNPTHWRQAKDPATEIGRPGYYSVAFSNDLIRAEMTASPRVAVYRFTYANGRPVRLLVDGQWNNTGNMKGAVKAFEQKLGADRRTIVGSRMVEAWLTHRIAWKIEFSRPWKSVREMPRQDGERGSRCVLEFEPGEVLQVKVALSSVDEEGAARNLVSDAGGKDFDAIREEARERWNRLLQRLDVAGVTDEQRIAIYTALYHLFLQPNDIADADGRYRGGDGRVAKSPDGHYYTGLSLWDTFRAAHPFYTLSVPERVDGFVNSMLAHYKALGYLPVIPYFGWESFCMIGNHAVPVVVDAHLKGFRGFDTALAFEAVTNSLSVAHVDPLGRKKIKEEWDVLERYGYYPFDLIRGESVSRTLECSYDDACAARFAKALGEVEAESRFSRRAANWRHLIDPQTGFARGKDSSGKWREPFDPFSTGHDQRKANDYTEGNAFQYTWHVLQDPCGLFDALGGREKAYAKLDALFKAPELLKDAPPDVSGLIGQYAHGNEPSHHVAYLFTLAGRPDRTAEVVREVCDRFYGVKPGDLCGNDDCGQMSAWYLFAVMGFYPVDPCGGDYVLGAPQVPEATLNLADGRQFIMRAKNLSRKNKYVKSVTLDGKAMTGSVIWHADIVSGGTLVFEMTDGVE